MRRYWRLAGDREELVEDGGESQIEVVVVGLLEEGQIDGLGDGPENVVGPAVVDCEPEHGTRIGSAVLLVGVGRAIRGDELKFGHEVGFGRSVYQLEGVGRLKSRVELCIGTIGIAGKRLGKEPAVGPSVGEKYGFGGG